MEMNPHTHHYDHQPNLMSAKFDGRQFLIEAGLPVQILVWGGDMSPPWGGGALVRNSQQNH